MFLLYAAQLRKSFDYQRFKLGQANGNNIQTYLNYLNFSAGQNISPLTVQNPDLYSDTIRMIEKWDIVPADDAYYPIEYYCEVKIAKDQYSLLANETKESFLNEFAYKYEKLLNDPKTLEVARFLQDYNFGNIPNNSQNQKKYKQCLEIFNSIMNAK